MSFAVDVLQLNRDNNIIVLINHFYKIDVDRDVCTAFVQAMLIAQHTFIYEGIISPTKKIVAKNSW